jgi:fatty acid desaturase
LTLITGFGQAIDGGLMDAEPTHRQAIAALDGLELSALKETANGPALVRLGGHAGVLVLAGGFIVLTQSWLIWCIAVLIYGIALMFLFSLEHETIHGTAFRSPWLNSIVAEAAGLPLLLPPRYFRYFHFAHHRHTQDPAHDPELARPKPRDRVAYLKYLSGLPYWRDAVAGLLRHASGRVSEDFIPAGGKARVIAEARAYMAIVVVLAVMSVWLGWTLPLELWVIPALVGQPFLRAYLLAEHAACPLVPDMLTNSRTTYTSSVIRLLAWNMPYHSAHHALPTVPFHRLPELNAKLSDRLRSTAHGYRDAHRQIRAAFAEEK